MELEKIIPVVERTLGEDHVGMKMTKGNLARAYKRAGRFNDADMTLRGLLGSMRTEHHDWEEALSGYVEMQLEMGDFEAAREQCELMLTKIRSRASKETKDQEYFVGTLLQKLDHDKQP